MAFQKMYSHFLVSTAIATNRMCCLNILVAKFNFILTDFLNVVRGLRQGYGPTLPLVVHSSAGDGTSGIVVLMDMLITKVDCNYVSHSVYINNVEFDSHYMDSISSGCKIYHWPKVK